MKIVNIEKMKEIDKRAYEKYKINEILLMENAAISSYNLLKENFKLKKEKIFIICGIGNNGGDGLALARKLYSENFNVSYYIIGNEEKYSQISKINLEILKNINIKREKDYEEGLEKATLIIDAIFGIGLRRNIEGEYFEIINKINNSNKKIVSLDIPSGINGDNGKIMGTAVKSTYTIAFGALKYGNILYPGCEYNGEISLSKISFPVENYNDIKTNINLPLEIPLRNENSHKDSFGKVVFLAGSKKYLGAPIFSTMGFLKSGGGYARLITSKSIINILSTNAKEIVYFGMSENESGGISFKNIDKIKEIFLQNKMIVVGPGISITEDNRKIIREIINLDVPILFDADALTIISKDINILYNRKNKTILTPHLGELSRLLNISIEKINKNRVEICKEFAVKYGVILVVKIARTEIYYPNGEIFINLSGNSALATAGSGDVLTGVIASQYILGLSIEEAVRQGVFLHGFTADIIAKNKGKDGVIASDLLEYLPIAMKKIRKNYNKILKKYSIKNY
ncbi:NAD(P)H-hydrate epimerase [Hypnocyclicus thermotrophus]|uniref:Bifunctional NAD(P)H-hydrate repair enzyme n=1 Tax=Hypnocyclicus thermotrophus TaxID=1627895 RepID=A0AA46E0Q9_9FUSO|nr:NAD(P)H-hydrate dehydratase [Hypnocyclicus thermotrophus]TDT72482.1 NAD(P)H-hydrate epimerase [Hypnocyclicus thermotrophus]